MPKLNRSRPGGKRLRRWRELNGVSIQEVAEKFGASVDDVESWEHRGVPRVHQAAIAQLLEISVSDLSGSNFLDHRAAVVTANIKAARKLRGLTQREAAGALGMTEANYNGIETGRHNPSIYTIMDIADLFKVTVASLTGESESADPLLSSLTPEQITSVRRYISGVLIHEI